MKPTELRNNAVATRSRRSPLGLRAGIPIVALAALFAACGGGGSGTHATVPGTGGGATVAGKAVLTIPNRISSSTKRSPKFVSASAVSVGVSVNGGTVTYTDVSSTSSACTNSQSGRTCTIPVTAPSGNVTFAFTLYDAANGGGNELGTGTVTQNVVIGTPFSMTVAIGGVVASVAITVPAIDVGPTSVPVTVTAKDADGNTIIGSAPYTTPLTLTNSDTTGTLTLSETTVKTPNDVITLAYTGGSLASADSISASGTGLAASAVTPASVLPLNYFPNNESVTFASSEQLAIATTIVGTNPLSAPSSPVPAPAPTTTSSSTTDTETYSSGTTFNGTSAFLQATTIGSGLDFASSTSVAYESLNNGVWQLGSRDDFVDEFGDTGQYTITYAGSGLAIAPLPLAPGGTVSSVAGYSSSEALQYSYGSGTIENTLDSSGNFTQSQTYADGSTEIEKDSAGGSATQTFTSGTTTPPSGGYWDNGLSANLTAASETMSAPSGGNIAITVSQTSAAGTQNGSLSVPVSGVYPSGVPSSTSSHSVTVGAPISAPPAPCAVTASYQGPVIPTTTVDSYWLPARFETSVTTTTTYYAPSIGIICSTASSQTSQATFGVYNVTHVGSQLSNYDFTDSFATTTLPLQLAIEVYGGPATSTSSLTGVGSVGNVTVSGHARSPQGNSAFFGMHRPHRPFLPHAYVFGGTL